MTIPGIGRRTAAALVAKIVSLDRFETPAKLVSYFGGFPEENTSGVTKQNQPIPQGTPHMSPQGNDLVRSLLWMAWLSGEDTTKGALTVGQLGDLAVISADYFGVPEEAIRGIESVLTVVGGKVVYAAGPFAAWRKPKRSWASGSAGLRNYSKARSHFP